MLEKDMEALKRDVESVKSSLTLGFTDMKNLMRSFVHGKGPVDDGSSSTGAGFTQPATPKPATLSLAKLELPAFTGKPRRLGSRVRNSFSVSLLPLT